MFILGMKRIAYFLLLVTLLSSCGPSHPLNDAQTEFNHSELDDYPLPTEWIGDGPHGRFMLGFTSGLNIATRFESPVSEGFSSYTEKRIIGALGGIELGYFYWSEFSYTAQILLDQKGFERNGVKSVFNYIEIPVTLNYPIFSTGDRKVYVLAGPTLGFPLDYGEFDYGVFAGMGFQRIYYPIECFLQVGYAFGLRNISPGFYYSLVDGGTYYREYSRDIRLQLGILFGK